MCVLQIKYLKDRVAGLTILFPHDWILDAHLLGGHVIFKYSFAVQADPCVFWAGYRDLYLRIFLHIFINIFLVIGAEPQLAVKLASEHKGTSLGFAVAADGS